VTLPAQPQSPMQGHMAGVAVAVGEAVAVLVVPTVGLPVGAVVPVAVGGTGDTVAAGDVGVLTGVGVLVPAAGLGVGNALGWKSESVTSRETTASFGTA